MAAMRGTYPDGRSFIVLAPLREPDLSPAMQAVSDHAAGWLATVDGLCVAGGLDSAAATRAADLGFRGDSIRAARAIAGGVR